jgi:hypothetical protein
MPAGPTSLRRQPPAHPHALLSQCPYCDQPIPVEQTDEVRHRIESRERDQAEKLSANIRQELAREKAQGEAAVQERIATLVATNAALQEAMNERITAAEQQTRVALSQYEALAADQEQIIAQRLQDQAELIEREKQEAVNAVNAKHFEETQRLTGKLEDLARQLERKTANELGEGAEIDLFESLKQEFEGDLIKRVSKGAAGADIIHDVVHGGKICGRIVYDAKNRNAWRNEYVTKLREDQIAADAQHAILSSLKFPADARQLQAQDGVIIANPARVLALVQMLRRHIVQIHTLRLSNVERDSKTDALYEFIRSERCSQLFARIDGHAENLLKIQAQERKAHDTTWKRQGTVYRAIQKDGAELSAEIDRIIGTQDESDQTSV